mgnify:CR=1 FL=1
MVPVLQVALQQVDWIVTSWPAGRPTTRTAMVAKFLPARPSRRLTTRPCQADGGWDGGTGAEADVGAAAAWRVAVGRGIGVLVLGRALLLRLLLISRRDLLEASAGADGDLPPPDGEAPSLFDFAPGGDFLADIPPLLQELIGNLLGVHAGAAEDDRIDVRGIV